MSTNVRRIEILDTTLRDGSQQEGLSLTVSDKIKIASLLDNLGVTFVEGGFAGASPKDNEFFRRAKTELVLENSKLVAFGSTRKPGSRPESDHILNSLIATGCEYVCIVAKAWDLHVKEVLLTSEEEALSMAYDSVKFLHDEGLEVIFDAEHFFDGFKSNRDFCFRVLEKAQDAGALRLVLCDTNGGSLPDYIGEIVTEVSERFDNLGIHCHNDTNCAVANSLAAVKAGVIHVQGCINGYGERTGNADLSSVIPNLSIKLGLETIGDEKLRNLTMISHHIAEIMNTVLRPQTPYVGSAAFAHKAGLHTSGLSRKEGSYEHIDPKLVGNSSRFLVSEMSGKATFLTRAQNLGVEISEEQLTYLADELKKREHLGYHYEAADASFELLLRRVAGWEPDFFTIESYKVESLARQRDPLEDPGYEKITEATVKLFINGRRIITTAEGNGPVNALDNALRSSLEAFYPQIKEFHLTDFKVRVLDSSKATAAVTRVLIDTSDGDDTWSTMGVSENVVEASWIALIDSINFGLLKKTPKL